MKIFGGNGILYTQRILGMRAGSPDAQYKREHLRGRRRVFGEW